MVQSKPFTWRVSLSKPALADQPDAQAKPKKRTAIVAVRKSAYEPGILSEQELLAHLKKVTRLDIDARLQQQLITQESSKFRACMSMISKATKRVCPSSRGKCAWPNGSAQDLVDRSLAIRRGNGTFTTRFKPDDDNDPKKARNRIVSCASTWTNPWKS